MDRHLSAFLPYERPAHHEDQLTRAAMIVMRAVPLARDLFLARLESLPAARLPEPEIDMQTRYVRVPPNVDEGEGLVQELVSVFLSPDEGRTLSDAVIEEREDEQRLDGVLRFGDVLVVVIESKVVGGSRTDQAELLRMRGVEVEESRIEHLGWHELLEDWWGLLERGMLAPAERVLIADLIAMAEEHFPHLLPFTTLARTGGHELRVQRRLMALLREATGIEEVSGELSPWVGAIARLDNSIGSESTQRVSIQKQNDSLALCTWPAELKPQARAFYNSDRGTRLVELVDASKGEWLARPNPHLGYRGARTVQQRLYMTCELGLDEYVARWSAEDFSEVGAHPFNEIADKLWPWLRANGYASSLDDERLDVFLEGLGRRDGHLRPGVEVRRLWAWTDAMELDEAGELVTEVRGATTELLEALREPLPPACAAFRSVASPQST